MPRSVRLTKSYIDRLTAGDRGRLEVYDSTVAGLVLRVGQSSKTYRVRYRTPTGQRRSVTLGRHGTLTVTQARERARRILVDVASGADPAAEKKTAREAQTVADLASRYLDEHARPKKKPRSVAADEANLRNHVLPALGTMRVKDVTAADVSRLHTAIGRRVVRGKRTTGVANRVLALLSKMFSLAERWGLREQNSNPAKGLERFRERKMNRFLSAEEYARLDQTLAAFAGHETTSERHRVAVRVIRVLRDTGMRCSEPLGLRWEHVDPQRGRLHLIDAKAGERYVPVGPETLASLSAERGDPTAWVFADPQDPTKPLSYNILDQAWRRIREQAELPGVRLHDLRHSHASAAARAGLSLPMIGALLGHRTPATTARYLHLVDDPVAEAAQIVEGKIRKADK